MANNRFNKQVTPKGYKMGGRVEKMGGGMMKRSMYKDGSQDLKASKDMDKRRKNLKTEKAIIKESVKSKYSRKEPPMKRERVIEGFKARGKAKRKDILGKVGKSALSVLGKVANPISGITGSLAKLRNKKNKADFKKGDYSDIRVKKMGGGSLKPVDPKTQKGLSKLPTEVRNKMGFMKKGGKVK